MTKDSTTPSGDRRVRRTQATLARALLALVEERDLSRISVSDVADRAGVSRTAFYDHYRDVHELAEVASTAMIDSLIDSVPSPLPDSADRAREGTRSLAIFFARLAEHAGLYRSLFGPHGSARVADHVRRRLTAAVHEHVWRSVHGAPAESDAATGSDAAPERDTPTESDAAPESDGSASDTSHDVTAAFTAGALFGVAADWLQRECPQTPDQMAALTWPLLISLQDVATGAVARSGRRQHPQA
ncbi:TetR/AcrR family transcriptional regulator [Streptosporangium lutulentum]|nr:TetR/AcrR family transcriptional regulator [Streptosporangium lutulentum]